MLINYDSGEKQTVRWRMKNKSDAEHWGDSNVWMKKTMNNDKSGETQWTTVCRIKIIKNNEYHYIFRRTLSCRQTTHVAVMNGSETEINKSKIGPNVFNIKVENVKMEVSRTGRTGQTQRMAMTQCSHSVMFVTFRLYSSHSKGQVHKKKYEKNTKGGLRVKSKLFGKISRHSNDVNVKLNVRQPLRRCKLKEMRVRRENGTGIARRGVIHTPYDVPKKFVRNKRLMIIPSGNRSKNSVLKNVGTRV